MPFRCWSLGRGLRRTGSLIEPMISPGPTSLRKNLIYLYWVQAANYLFPLLTFPYLARVLQPEGFALLALGQALASYLNLLVEYGFNLSGTRAVAQARASRRALLHLLQGVLGAKLLLLFPAGLGAVLAYLLLPTLGEHLELVIAAFFYAAAWAFSPLWFYRGLERVREVALIEVGTRLLATLAIFAFVRQPSQAYLPMLLNGLAALVASAWGLGRLWRELGFAPLSVRTSLGFLREGFGLFFFQVVMALYLSVNTMVLSLFVTAREVGLFAGAERIARALWGMVDPMNRAFFPRMAHLVAQDKAQARRFAARVALAMGGGGLLVALVVWISAPWLVYLLLGGEYRDTTHLLRVMVWILPFGALSNALGVQWMVALGLEGALNTILVIIGLFYVALSLLLAWLWGPLGVAWGTVVLSALELCLIGGYLFLKGQLPFKVGGLPWR